MQRTWYSRLAALTGLIAVNGCAAERATDVSAADVADYERALEEARAIQPDSSAFELVNTFEPVAPWEVVPDGDVDPMYHMLSAPEDELEALDDEEGDLMQVRVLDGRDYRELPGMRPRRTVVRSRAAGDDGVDDGSATAGADGDGLLVPYQIVGADNRKRTTSKGRQAVQVKLAGSKNGTVSWCSASMISPRVFLTAAHCLTDGDGEWDYEGRIEYVQVAARGPSYSGANNQMDENDKPFGSRKILSYIKPQGWKGGGPRYDYALLIIGDHAKDTTGAVRWNPKPMAVEKASCLSIDYSPVNLRGYPANWLECADASAEDAPECGGYGYYHSSDAKECFISYFVHTADAQGGQSGSALYQYFPSSGKRRIVGIHKGAYGTRNVAHRIRAGSLGMICDVLEDSDHQSSHFPNWHCN